MNQKTLLIGCGVVLLFAGNAARTEYARITSRIETTQAKVDALADELAATTKTIHAAIRSITDRFTKAIDDKAMQLEESFRGEVYRIESKPTIIEHPRTNEPIKTFEPPRQPRIVMHSGYSCGPCNAWLATEKSKWEQSGWTIEVIKEVESTRGWPWFEIFDRDGKCFQVDGPLTNDKFQSTKRNLLNE
jgi:outer membrane murein-binding lipoprotein Lpp